MNSQHYIFAQAKKMRKRLIEILNKKPNDYKMDNVYEPKKDS
jgi:hypothetical protein